MKTDFPKSPTGTIGLQKSFAVNIRKTFRDGLRDVYGKLSHDEKRITESLRLTASIDAQTIATIIGILEKIKFDLGPIVKTYIGAAWWKANKSVAIPMKLGEWVPFDQRILKASQDSTYSYLYKFVDGKQEELKKMIQEGISQGDTVSSIAQEIKNSFKITAWKSELIARSEVVRTHGDSTMMAIRNGGVTKEYQWKTSLRENVCPICRPLHNRIFNIDDPRAPKPVTDTHPACNCGIVPYVRIAEVQK